MKVQKRQFQPILKLLRTSPGTGTTRGYLNFQQLLKEKQQFLDLTQAVVIFSSSQSEKGNIDLKLAARLADRKHDRTDPGGQLSAGTGSVTQAKNHT